MQKIGTLLFGACLGTVLLTGTAKADSVFNSLQLAQATPPQPEKALQVVKLIEPLDPELANQALTNIAREYTRTKHFDQALQVVELIKDNDLVNWARIAIATEYANGGQLDRALQVADTIQITERRPPNNGTNSAEAPLKNQTLAALAVLYAQAERFPQALQLVQTIQPDALKDQVLIAIAKQQAKAG
jgi:tetratricopeptide (TPR) repeat protein